MHGTRTYPRGVPSWVDTEPSDPRAAQDFYGQLFGWTFTTVSPPGAPYYALAELSGRQVAGIGSGTGGQPVAWNTYIAVDDADAVAARVVDLRGRVPVEPVDVGSAGRAAVCADPAGAAFRLWQARERPGAQLVNAPGAWNFSDLHANGPQALGFYIDLSGWEVANLGLATLIRLPGYADRLEASVDPDIRARQRGVMAPAGFEDAIAWLGPLQPDARPHWHVTFAVADRDASVATAMRLGATILSTEVTRWTRTALIRDPQGGTFTASQFTPDQPQA
ncbi:MAG: VOC family protein [Chloroflexi bacterium]|nr:VOC family protein [Chloroflexota bacterium]